jgi:hypothetical protein
MNSTKMDRAGEILDRLLEFPNILVIFVPVLLLAGISAGIDTFKENQALVRAGAGQSGSNLEQRLRRAAERATTIREQISQLNTERARRAHAIAAAAASSGGVRELLEAA